MLYHDQPTTAARDLRQDWQIIPATTINATGSEPTCVEIAGSQRRSDRDARQAGDRVKAGDLLIRLLPDDEKRVGAEQGLASPARLETARIP
jgi:hypothetical protein